MFRGSDIKDLQILEPPLRQNVFQQYHRSLDDPAILSGGSSYTPLGGIGYGGLYDSLPLGGTAFGTSQGVPSAVQQHSFPSQQQYPGVFSPFQQGPWGLVPDSNQESLETERKLSIPFGSDRQVQGNDTLGEQHHTETGVSKSSLQAVGGAPSKPRGWGPPPTKDLDPRVVKGANTSETSQQLKDVERKDSIQKDIVEPKLTKASGKPITNGVDTSERSYARGHFRQNYEKGTYRGRGRPYYRPSRGGGFRGRSRVQNSVLGRDSHVEEFDVVAMNEKFEKVHLEEKNTVEQQVVGSERKYDKQVSFFDQLSSSTTEAKEDDSRFKSAE